MQNSQGFSQGVFLSQGISHIFHSIFTGFHPIVVVVIVIAFFAKKKLKPSDEHKRETLATDKIRLK